MSKPDPKKDGNSIPGRVEEQVVQNSGDLTKKLLQSPDDNNAVFVCKDEEVAWRTSENMRTIGIGPGNAIEVQMGDSKYPGLLIKNEGTRMAILESYKYTPEIPKQPIILGGKILLRPPVARIEPGATNPASLTPEAREAAAAASKTP